ncbi:prion-inhibition and propagation domain-containing protein [Trichoderma sp. SZMC 28014]
MDITSFAISIADLYTTCREGYNFFTTVQKAEAESFVHVRELEIQQSILKSWGFHWQIQREYGSEPEHSGNASQKQTKLQKYLSSNQFKAEGVLKTLSALADTLSDQEKLTKRYGIHLHTTQAIRDGSDLNHNVQLVIKDPKIEDVEPVIKEVKNRLSILKKFKWASKDKEKFEKLIAELKSHSDSLYRLCPENAFESMNIYFIMECLYKQESPAGLRWMSKFATQQALVDGKSSVRQGYELLASAATLKASVNENRDGKKDDRTLTKTDEKQHELRYLGKGLALYNEQVVYVEMRDYHGPTPKLTPEQKKQVRRRNRPRVVQFHEEQIIKRAYYDEYGTRHIDEYDSIDDSEEDVEPIEIVRPADPVLRNLIGNFFHTFHGANKMGSVYGLDVVGMIDHTEGEHKGYCSILYKLPDMAGVQGRGRPAEDLKLRAPVTLQSLLTYSQKQGIRYRCALGARFKLAKKLVRAVCLLHSSGWLHKNIRAESVLYFPEHGDELPEGRYEAETKIDISKPVLMGYIFSRPDDIIYPIIQPSTQTGDDLFDIGRRPEAGPTKISRVSYEEVDVRAGFRRRMGTPHFGSIYGRRMQGNEAVAERTKVTNIRGFTLDYYQHPAKHADPKRQYRHAYDVYSLGILLLEIGLWEKLRDYEELRDYNYSRSGLDVHTVRFEADRETDREAGHDAGYDEEDHYERRRWICREYLDRLRWTCGDTYADAVLSCLMIDSSDDEMARASERELCARIIADLEGCQA